MDVKRLKRVLDCQGVHNRRQHAHVIAGHAVHAGSGQTFAAKDVAPADDDRNLDTGFAGRRDFGGNPLNDGGLDPVIQLSHERFATQFEQNAAVLTRTVIHTLASSSRRPTILAQWPFDHTRIRRSTMLVSWSP